VTGALAFWCELASTYTYLSALRIEPLAAAHGVSVRYEPFSLGPIFAAQGWSTSPFVLQPAKGRYMWRDVARLADQAGLAFRRPSVFPRNSIPALRLALVARAHGFVAAFVQAALRANFAEDRDIAEPAVLDEILADLGHDAPSLRAQSVSPTCRPLLRSQTERAAAQGVFGAPFFFAGDEPFWGNDRLEQAVVAARCYHLAMEA
jgi:2-hydroxychromene-2-carboxylate isomerase